MASVVLLVISTVDSYSKVSRLPRQDQQQQEPQPRASVYRRLPDITLSGQPGRDYPLVTTVPPTTSFTCSRYNYSGQFADPETDCQVIY